MKDSDRWLIGCLSRSSSTTFSCQHGGKFHLLKGISVSSTMYCIHRAVNCVVLFRVVSSGARADNDLF